VPAVKPVAIIAALLVCFFMFVPHAALAQGLDEAAALNQQVIQLYNHGRYSEATPLAQRALTIREKALSPDHPDIAGSLNSLASLYRAQGRYADAESLFDRSLAIREKVFGPAHPEVAGSLNNLALLFYLSRS
jgi:tetratricopeptide (TPR) repeat protein